jgi:hypothetical protein
MLLLLSVCNAQHNYGVLFSLCYRHCNFSEVVSHGTKGLFEEAIVCRSSNAI